MKSAVIIPNYLKANSVEFSKIAEEQLNARGYEAIILGDNEKMTKEAEFAIALGGDGTIIRACKQLYGTDIPVLGINFGHLGYLTECGPENAIEAINKLANKDYKIENRIMICGSVIRGGTEAFTFTALNEAALNRATLMRAFKMEISVNGRLTNTVLGDGLIVATPTGSTSYNLSAGGPILTPTANNIVITQIAPIYFPGSPLVTDGNDEIEIRILVDNTAKSGNVAIEIDGNDSFKLQSEDIIKIKRAEHNAKIAKVTDTSFYQILREKLSKANFESSR